MSRADSPPERALRGFQRVVAAEKHLAQQCRASSSCEACGIELVQPLDGGDALAIVSV